MKKMLFLIVIFAVTINFSACEKAPMKTIGNVQVDTVRKLIGEWKWILNEDFESGKFTPADNNTILKISAIDSTIIDNQEFAVAYEVFVEETLFRKNVSPIYSVAVTPGDEEPYLPLWTRGGWFYLPYVEMRSCNFQFASHNGQPSLDTLCFGGSLHKVYYARILYEN